MNQLLLRAYIAVTNLLDRADGQDLAEYALASALIAFGSVAAMNSIANGVGNVFTHVSTVLGDYIQ